MLMNAQSNAWITGNQYTRFTDTGLLTVALPQPGGVGNYSGSIADHNQYIEYSFETGILFFIIDSNIYDREGYLIADNQNASSCGVCTPLVSANVMAAHYPGMCDKFWVFFGKNAAFLDLSLPNAFFPNRNGRLVEWDTEFINPPIVPAEMTSFFAQVSTLNDYGFNSNAPTNAMWRLYTDGALNAYPCLILPTFTNGAQQEGASIAIDLYDDNVNDSKYLALVEENRPAIFEISASGIWFNVLWNTTYAFGAENQNYCSIEFTRASNGDVILATGWNVDATMHSSDDNLFIFRANSDFSLLQVTPFNAHLGSVEGKIGDLAVSPNGDVVYFGLDESPYIGYYQISTSLSGDFSSLLTTIEQEAAGRSQLEIQDYNGNPVLYFADDSGLSVITSPDSPTNASFLSTVVSNSELGQIDSFIAFNELYLLQHQAYNETYQAATQPLDCCAFSAEQLGEGSHKITGVNNWSVGTSPFEEYGGVVYFDESIVFEAGSTTTISDLEFRFSPEAKVTIEAGARVNLDGCLWTAWCDLMWPGVELLGTTNNNNSIPQVPFSSGNQGVFTMTNSVIEYAVNGLQVGTTTNTGGGVVRAIDSEFRNCVNGVIFRKYRFANANGNYVHNLSTFRECLFITNQNYRAVPFFHAQMHDVDWVKYIDCSFVNSNGDNVAWYNRGSGILAFRASFLVDGSNEPWLPVPMPEHPTAFHKLRFGIYSAALGDPLATYTCRQMEFRLCLYGIVNYATHNIMVHENNFLIADLPGLNGIDETGFSFGSVERGMYITNSDSYTVEQNTFSGFDNFQNPEPFPNAIGVWVNNSGENANEIRNNDFSEMKMGILVTRDNIDSESRQTGLQLLCNTFSEDEIDIYVGEQSTMRWVQGAVQTGTPNDFAAGNIFSSANCDGFSSDFLVHPYNTHWYMYIHNTDALAEPDCESVSTHPNYFGQSLLITAPGYGAASPSDCPNRFGPGSNGPTPPTIGGLVNGLVTAHGVLNEALSNYALVVDANQKESTITILNEAFPNESQFYRDLLLQRHPLSDEVLKEVIQRAERLNEWHLTQVFLSNSPLRKEILAEIENSGILSPFFLDFLYNVDSGQSLRTLMELDIMAKATERDRLLNEVYAAGVHYETDPESEELMPIYASEYLNALDLIGGKGIVVQQAASLVRRGEYSEASSLLSQFDGFNSIVVMYAIESELNDHDWSNASEQHWQVIRSISSDQNDEHAPLARALLISHGQFTVEPEPELPIQLKSIRAPRTPADKKPLLGVWPNPAGGQAWLHYPKEADEADDAQITVFDSNGQMVLQFQPNHHGLVELSVIDLPPGLYLVQLIAFGRTIETIKLTVQR